MGRQGKRAATVPWAVCLSLMLSVGAAGQNEHGTTARPKEALRPYRQVLTVAPGRRIALQEAAEAERAVGMSGKTNQIN